MPIELVAVDIDNTFLRKDKSYDKKRFDIIYEKMKEKGIMFVVASGGQLSRLRSYFPKWKEMFFIAENGSWILHGENELQDTVMAHDKVIPAINALNQLPDLKIMVCGKKATYILDTVPDDVYKQMLVYCPDLEKVENFDTIDDEVIKLSIKNTTYTTEDALALIEPILGNTFTPVPSGHISIDVITPGMHKGAGIDFLCKKYGISPEKTMAFGDNENDREMLAYAEHAYVMENAVETLFDVSPLRAKNNEDQGVLDILEEWFL